MKTGRGAVREGDARVEVDVLLRCERFLPSILEDGAKLGDSFLRFVGGRSRRGQRFAFSKISRRVIPRHSWHLLGLPDLARVGCVSTAEERATRDEIAPA